jgi:hypothetical protein
MVSDDDFDFSACLINAYGVDEKVPFLTRPPMVKENLDGDNSESSATEERIIPPKVIEIIDETDELENWPHFPSWFCHAKTPVKLQPVVR